MPIPPIPPEPRRALRWRAPVLLALVVVTAHAMLLGAVPLGVGDGGRNGVRTTLLVRQIERPPAAVVPAQPMPAAVLAAPTPKARVAAVAAVAADFSASAPPVLVAAAEVPAPAPVIAVATAPIAGDEDGKPPPVYATRMPPPALLRYDLKRGGLTGVGELAWRPADKAYQLTMEGKAFSFTVLNWASQGNIDHAGIAPDRFTDRRRGRDVRAANFQRDKGLITFSGPQVEYPLFPGTQDRLSWMLQLSAIVEADPKAYAPGAHIVLFVVGSRGEGDIWTFTVEGHEALSLPIGHIANTLRLKREPNRPYDTLGEIWLDPARSHLPVRVRLSVPQAADETSEFLLREMAAP